MSEAERRELASGFAKRLTYTLAVHRGDGENPHAHLMISERGLDGVERDSETWFRRYNRQEPEKGGAHKSRAAMPKAWLEDTRKAWEREANEALERAGYGERIDHRSLAERRDAAERSGDLELAAELSRKPNVHLGPQALKELPGEPESFAHQKAERVKEDNAALVEERDGYLRQLRARIKWLTLGIQEFEKAIVYMRDRIANRSKYMSPEQFKREWIEKIRKEDERWVRPRKARQTRGHERDRDVGPSR